MSVKFWIAILVMYALVLVGLIAYAYIMDRLDLNKPAPSPSPRPVQNFYREYHSHYSVVAEYVRRCLYALSAEYHICRPRQVEDVYAADTSARVELNQGRILFRYEVQLEQENVMMGGGGKILPQKERDWNGLAERIKNNLADTLGSGYYFSGPVFVNRISGNQIRVEICGVGRNIEYPPAGVIL